MPSLDSVRVRISAIEQKISGHKLNLIRLTCTDDRPPARNWKAQCRSVIAKLTLVTSQLMVVAYYTSPFLRARGLRQKVKVGVKMIAIPYIRVAMYSQLFQPIKHRSSKSKNSTD